MAQPRLEFLEDRQVMSAMVVGAAQGTAPTVKVVNESGAVVQSFLAYDPSFRGGVNVAQGDVTGDKIADIITSPVKGRAAVKVFDGATHALLGQFTPYGNNYRGGVNVAVGQILDGTADIVTGTASGQAVVKVFDGKSLQEIRQITPYGRGVNGVNVAVANLSGGRLANIVTAPASGGQPVVNVYDASTGGLVNSILAYAASYRGGVQIDSGDFNGNRVPDLVTAPGSHGKPLIRVWASQPGNPLVGQFVATTASGVPRGGISLGTVTTAGIEPDRITVAPTRTVPGSGTLVGLYDTSGNLAGNFSNSDLGRGALSFSSAASEVFQTYAGPKLIAVNYSPTWPNWNPNKYGKGVSGQLSDSDFANTAFQGLWDIDPTTNQGRQDLQTLKDNGFNTIRLYNWGPSRGWNGTTAAAHIPFLDKAQSLGMQVIVPVSNYFLGNDQYSWNGQNPDANFSFGSAPQAIQDDLMMFIRSITKNGQLHPAVNSIGIGNEMDLGMKDGDPGNTAKLQRALWWVVNLHDQLAAQFGTNVPLPFLSIPISNADQGNGGTNKSWLQLFDHGVSAGDTMPIGSVPGGNFTATVKGLSSYSWYTTWFYNSVNMFQLSPQLPATLQQYDTGIPTGNTWSQQWPGEKLPVPLFLSELGTYRYTRTADYQYNAVTELQAQPSVTALKTLNNFMGFTTFEFNDEPNKDGYQGPTATTETTFGITTYNTSPDWSQFRNGTLLYSLHTGATQWIGGWLPDEVYPVYQLFPIQSSSGSTILKKLKEIFAQLQ